ncbi:MAG: hypothetical protein RIE73_37960 [Coleofasciculus sp. C1-SOL-03]|uniref:hypothetical protein n=1 Tax=Coleofasciculus sp. C1-SOL-03 TaxID=3069522 RepID=UPI0033005659
MTILIHGKFSRLYQQYIPRSIIQILTGVFFANSNKNPIAQPDGWDADLSVVATVTQDN